MATPTTGQEQIPGCREVLLLHESPSSRVFYAEGREGGLVVAKQFVGDTDSADHARFAQEAEMLGTFDHPQIPVLIEDNTDHFHPHFIMEAASGLRPLGPDTVSPLAAGKIIHSVLDPLGYVHERNIVHRDIKPDNILALWLGRPLLSDFGIAGRLSEIGEAGMDGGHDREEAVFDFVTGFGLTHAASTGLTEHDRIVGTPAYMAPEQVLACKADRTSDLYSVGKTFYHLLWGELPHEAFRNLDDAQAWHWEHDIEYAVPQGRDIPASFVAIVERATQPVPFERYQSAEEMQEAIAKAALDAGAATY